MEGSESLSKLFQDLGCKVESEAVLDKCLELCAFYNVDVEKLTELWLTFCVNNDYDIDPTLDTLIKMEKEVLKKDYEAHNLRAKKNDGAENVVDEHFIENKAVENDDMLSMYGCTEPGTSKLVQRTPEVEVNVDSRASRAKPAEHSFSPASNAANSSTPSRRNVADKGKILLSLGETVASWTRTGDYDVEVAKSDEPHVPQDVKYMYEILSRQNQGPTCMRFAARLRKASIGNAVGKEMHYVKDVRNVNQTYFRTFGRVATRKESASNTATLEGCARRKGASVADTIEMDLRNTRQYSLFSGQIVVVEATNPVGDTLYVKDIFAKAYAPSALVPRIESRLNIIVAAGPFTASNNMHYQPLWDLMERVASDKPHVLILVGPFLEFTHPEIQDGLNDTHQEHFEKILARIMESTRRSTQVVLVASNRDAHHEPIFPSPQYTVYNRKFLQNYPNLKLMPDPYILDVAGLKIGVTSVDVIKHIGKEEISNISGMDRLSRLADHVLAQTCFYPVYPPSEDLNVDTELWEKYAFFEQQPHILILPSDMRCYCKVINECVTLNPERMHKHTYARLSVKPTVDGKWSSDNISCEIAKI